MYNSGAKVSEHNVKDLEVATIREEEELTV
jgi:hypothetical protein